MNAKSGTLFIALAAAFQLATSGAADARVTRLVIEKREAAPGKAGSPAYEILSGHVFGELDPANPQNAVITDIAHAPRNARGQVEYAATFALAKPLDMAQASGVLFYDVPNRGVAAVGADEDGHIRVISGWQGDIPPAAGAQTLTAPVAAGLSGAAFIRFVGFPPSMASLPLATSGRVGLVPGPTPASLDTRKARLFHQAADDQPPIDVASEDWAFADCTQTPFPGRPSDTHVCVRGGFDPNLLYGLAYTARDPKVLGVGFAATRDLNAFLRHAARDDVGAANPVAGAVRWTVASGSSQSGNFLRSFLRLGFNQDEAHRIVFDGVNPDIAGRQLALNIRFATPGGASSLYELGSEGPVWWSPYADRARGRKLAGLLDRCAATATCPKIVETFGSAEIWALRMSPDLIGTDAARDIPLPANVRRYYFPSVSHGGAFTGGAFSTTGAPAVPGSSCALPFNPNPTADTLRVLQKRLVDWVRGVRPPPASRYPTLAAGELVDPSAAAMGWPDIPGAPAPDGKLNPFREQAVGTSFLYEDLSGAPEFMPPKIVRTFPMKVPRVNADGNETAGVPSVQLLAPLGTYTGWNVQAQGYGKGSSCGLWGGFIPFAKSKAERLTTHDPRPSLEERYGDHAGYVAGVQAVVARQVADGWLLADDGQRLVMEAETSQVLK